jgi:predicted methyltransferase
LSSTTSNSQRTRGTLKTSPTIPSSIVEESHRLIALHLGVGDIAIDATAGNGHDTAFLALRVGPTGHVYAFDIQEEAVAAARNHAKECHVADRVTLFQAGHEEMNRFLPESARGKCRTILFNLGYLPGGTRTLVTRPDTTLRAIDQSLKFLAPLGLLVLVVYRGHPGGMEEDRAIAEKLNSLAPKEWEVTDHGSVPETVISPRLYSVTSLT